MFLILVTGQSITGLDYLILPGIRYFVIFCFICFDSMLLGSNSGSLVERHSLVAFQHLVAMSIEGLELWRMICEHQFHVVIHNANPVS